MVRLLGYGWPRGALRMTLLIFWDIAARKWTWHAVLCVCTDHGPWILDNRLAFPRVAVRIPGYYWNMQEKPGDEKWQRIALERELRK